MLFNKVWLNTHVRILRKDESGCAKSEMMNRFQIDGCVTRQNYKGEMTK